MSIEIELDELNYEKIPMGITGESPEDALQISYKAIDEMKKMMVLHELNDEYYIRIFFDKGGTTAKSYSLKFEKEIRDFDRVFPTNGIRLVADMKSVFFLTGIKIDYISTDSGSGFVFIQP